MRSFLGIEIPKRIKDKCIQIQKKIENTNADVKLVEKDNLHWTVKFLGEIKDKQLRKLKKITKETTTELNPLKIGVGGLGVFPNQSYIKTIWVGVSENEGKFTFMIEKINENLENSGFRKEKHDITPHMTVARVKSGKKKEILKEILHNMKDVKVGKMEIEKVTLYKSKLKPSGPVYNKIDEFRLGE